MIIEDEQIEGTAIHATKNIEEGYKPSLPFMTKTVRLGVAFALVLAIGFMGGMSVNAENASKVLSAIPVLGDGLSAAVDNSADFTAFWKAWNLLNSRYVETHASTTIPTVKEKVYGAIAGMTSSFGDPYTVFMPPKEAKGFQDQIRGNFEGVGMEMGVKNGVLTVIAPLKDTPAEKAGIKAGDAIVAIDGKSTDGMSTDEAVGLIRGPKGTVVTLKVVRDQVVSEIKITRDTINTPTIDSKYDSANGVYTISLYTFTANSGELFTKALTEFRNSGSRKLIIDVRGNPGGYLEAAVSIASHFLPQGSMVVTEDYKGKQENLVHRSAGTGGIPEGTKVVVLIDQGSASASEILAGALQDYDAATLIGTRSFGKGSVQELIDIDGGSLKVTVARWLTPKGRSISDGGLTPNIKVEFTPEDIKAKNDPQWQRALQFFKTGQ